MKIRRRTLATIGLFLLAGAAVNVGVAWCFLAAESFQSYANANSAYANATGFKRTTTAWAYDSPPGWPAPISRMGRDAHGVTWRWDFFQSQTPDDRAGLASSGGLNLGAMRHAIGVRAGRPFRSLHAIAFADAADFTTGQPSRFPPFRYRGGWALSDTEPWLMAPYAILPVGFAANTAIYALLLFLLVAATHRGVRSVMHARRLARGLCPRCRYDIRDLAVCPECGSVIQRKSASP